MPRWINVTGRFEYTYPDRLTTIVFNERDFGDHMVKDEIADYAVNGGFASEGKADEQSRSDKGRRRTPRKPSTTKSSAKPQQPSRRARPRATAAASDAAANLEPGNRVGAEDADDADRADDRGGVDSASG
jgi:hypothetical protein